jgi:hypothetical protein
MLHREEILRCPLQNRTFGDLAVLPVQHDFFVRVVGDRSFQEPDFKSVYDSLAAQFGAHFEKAGSEDDLIDMVKHCVSALQARFGDHFEADTGDDLIDIVTQRAVTYSESLGPSRLTQGNLEWDVCEMVVAMAAASTSGIGVGEVQVHVGKSIFERILSGPNALFDDCAAARSHSTSVLDASSWYHPPQPQKMETFPRSCSSMEDFSATFQPDSGNFFHGTLCSVPAHGDMSGGLPPMAEETDTQVSKLQSADSAVSDEDAALGRLRLWMCIADCVLPRSGGATNILPEDSVDSLGAESECPKAFECPITDKCMVDPVVASDGHTYERAAIEEWLVQRNNSRSPVTNGTLSDRTLRPNFTLRSMIASWKANQQLFVFEMRSITTVQEQEQELFELISASCQGTAGMNANSAEAQKLLQAVSHVTISSLQSIREREQSGGQSTKLHEDIETKEEQI